MPLLSVIVPIYNTEKYLEKCIKSIVNQSYKDIEIILVDDGSTDGSKSVCNKFVKEDNRIKYVYKENEGEIFARGTGLDYASGKYVIFVDSDDYVDDEYCEVLVNDIQKYDVDLVEVGMWFKETVETHGKIKTGLYKTKEEMLYIKENFLYYKDTGMAGMTYANYARIYKREKINRIFEEYKEFNKRIDIGGDTIISYMYILECESIYISDKCCYRYVNREGSAVNKKYFNYLSILSDWYNILYSISIKYDNKYALIDKLEKTMKLLILSSTKMLGFSEENQISKYGFPFDINKQYVIYGAGNVGCDYIKHLLKNDQMPLAWLDKNSDIIKNKLGIEIIKPNRLIDLNFDYVIIAVLEKETADKIKVDLIDMGIDEKKILWKEPIRLF